MRVLTILMLASLLFSCLSGLSDPPLDTYAGKMDEETAAADQAAQKMTGKPYRLLTESYKKPQWSIDRIADTLAAAICDCLSAFDVEKGAKAFEDFRKASYAAGKVDLHKRRVFRNTYGRDAKFFESCNSVIVGHDDYFNRILGSYEPVMNRFSKECAQDFSLYQRLYADHRVKDDKMTLEVDFYVSDEQRVMGDNIFMAMQAAERKKAQWSKSE